VNVYILDTNILTLIFKYPKQYPHLLERIKQTPYEHIWISVISIDEAIRGAYRLMHQEHKPFTCFKLLTWIVTGYGQYQILTYDENDGKIFDGFSPAINRGVQQPDRKIAATAIRHNYAVITKKLQHFQLTGCRCEDWTVIS